MSFLSCKNRDESQSKMLELQSEPMVLILKNQNEELSKGTSDQVTKALDYAKIPFLTTDLGIISRTFNIPSSIRTLVITTPSVENFDEQEVQNILKFVAKGGSLVFTNPVLDQKYSFLQGLKPNADFVLDSVNSGFHLYEEAFPGMKGQTFEQPGLQTHYGLIAGDFSNETMVLAGTATNTGQPFIVSNKIGLGEVLTINSFIMNGKVYRGILFSTILRTLPGIPYQVANVSTIFLDDFPAPLYNEKLPPIDKEYDVTHAEFVSKIWWPDMKALADSFGIDYSAMVAFNYNANVVPPFDFQEWRQGSIVFNQNIIQGSIFLAKDIRDTRHELAFHGYNHFSLWDNDWDNINFMISALQAARKRWQVDDLGTLPTNYVPPTNEIDSLGLEAIIRGMPSINYMSSLYFGEIEDGGGREFDPDPYVPAHIFNYPRISSGFTMSTNTLFNQQGLQLLTGIWTHFVHPDDVFQVIQRSEDEYSSRNPLGLGWKSSEEHSYGLYDLLSRRIKYTLRYYPLNDFLSATEGAKYTEDWRRSLSGYTLEGNSMKVRATFRDNYEPKVADSTRSWFMYVPEDRVTKVEQALASDSVLAVSTGFWDGFLFQFKTDKTSFTLPNPDISLSYDPQFIASLTKQVQTEYQQFRQAATVLEESEEKWRDTRLEDALRALRKNPDNRNIQEQVINLSIEFGQVQQAISILEDRLLDSQVWIEEDITRLLTYYGWEGLQGRAENFLEQLWSTYQNKKVIDLKNTAVEKLGLYGEKFEQRWRQRELRLSPDDYQLKLNYTKSIESQENWPEMKRNLLELLEIKPDTDSLYAFTLQRSIYYESQDSTLALIEEFPPSAYSQLTPFASNLALMYGFTANDYEKALFWANNAPDFDERIKLYWLSQLDLDQLYKAKALELLERNPDDSELRSFVGTNLFYEGFTKESYQVLYPLFEREQEQGFTADTLLRNEIGYMGYEKKKDFYERYPLFFDDDQREGLQRQYRLNEGIRGQVFGEYRDDNFNNTFARGGISAQFGNRTKNTHLLKTEYLIFADDNPQTNEILQYQGLGYEFASRSNNQQIEFRVAPTVLFGESDFIPQALISLGVSKDSAYTSLQLTGGSELTSTSLQNDYYQAQLQFYRQDFWFRGALMTSLSGSGKYYTNDVFSYGGQTRLYLDLMEAKWRLRPVVEIGYADATVSYISGIPYYTPDNYFSQGLGVDLQFRNPDSFEYRTQLTGEIMGKHESREGFFASGRIQLEHKFQNFWEISIGSEFSTSSIYRSNRIFFTISHYFPRSINKLKR
ncbi:DUF2194 domain-containing protein [Gracilimonas tropica]|uniref:DUF2194 domain-containing protein n=1 Tax=Gracilimonas tropica TaxID=454600 RepID=UPI0012F7FF48